MDSLDPKTLPQGGANVGTVIPLICSCPPKCVCGSKESKKWCHAQCSNPSFISEAGDILCKNHLGACSSYFIKDASFKCEESENYEKYSAAYEFFQVLAQTMQASSYKLDEKDQVKFMTTLSAKIMQRWFM